MRPFDFRAAGAPAARYRRVRSHSIGEATMTARIGISGVLVRLAVGLSAPVFAGDDMDKSVASAERSAKMFERIKALVGEWQGTYEWTGGRTGSGNLRATYALTGAGSVVMEHLLMSDGVPSMSS